MFLASQENSGWRGAYVRAILISWAAEHPKDQLQSVDLFFWFHLNRLEDSTVPEKTTLWHYEAPPPANAPPVPSAPLVPATPAEATPSAITKSIESTPPTPPAVK